MNNINQAVLAEQTGYHGFERVDAVAAFVLGVHLAPGVEKLVRSVEGAELVINAVGDDDESGVFEQCRNIAAVADGKLLVGVLDGGVLLEGVLELEHHHGQAVDEDDGIGDAVLESHDVELVHHLEDVVLLIGIVEGNGIDIEVFLFSAIFSWDFISA